jgi:hypothetical protein
LRLECLNPSILKTERPPVTCARSNSYCGRRNRPTAPPGPSRRAGSFFGTERTCRSRREMSALRRRTDGRNCENRVKNASRLAAALPSSPCLRSLRPILAEHDPDHDHRAGCDHHRADPRQLFEDSENGCPPPIVSREAPACHTHSETPFGPSSEFLTTRSARQQSANSGAALRPHRHPCSGCCPTAGAI